MNSFYRSIIKNLNEAVISANSNGNIIIINDTAEMLLRNSGVSFIGRNILEILEIKENSEIEFITKNKDLLSYFFKEGKFDTITRKVEIKIKEINEIYKGLFLPVYNKESEFEGINIIFDISQINIKKDEEMRDISKIQSIGYLAGGIAHDFNNILTTIIGSLNLVRYQCKISNDCASFLTDAENSVDKMKKLTHQLLTFLNYGSANRKLVNISEIAEKSTILTLSGSSIQCNLHFEDNLDFVEVENSQISHAFNNILINSIEAMPDGGKIDVFIKNTPLYTGNRLNLPEGRYVQISIEDHGIGIFEDDLPLVFEPFFTTKSFLNENDEEKYQRGLGLTIAQSIIKNHRGFIEIRSEVGVGTKVVIYLPSYRNKSEKKLHINLGGRIKK